ncbi:MAG: creatininase family protein [Bacteroidales bacterium]
MKKNLIFLLLLLLSVAVVSGQVTRELPFKYEEITSPEFAKAVEKAGGVCIIPIGIMEKHGPHLPLGTDLFEIREVATNAARKEYAIVFPPYYTGQIFEAKHQPGAIAYSNDLMWKMLDETCRELSRNGLRKIILANGHGGNNAFLQYFCQSQLSGDRDYVVVLFQGSEETPFDKEIASLKKAKLDGHAGEEETSMMYFIRPDLVNTSAMTSESGLDQDRLARLTNGYTGIWWYAKYPNHFASDITRADRRLGELLVERDGLLLSRLVKFMKTDNSVETLQKEFIKRAGNPTGK